MQILVGVPTHKRPVLLRACLESIAAQTGLVADVQVFVADNDPAGRAGIGIARKLAPAFPFPLRGEVVEEPGISAVRNAILGEARRNGTDFIAWIDDDETASPEWLQNLLTVQHATGADCVGGPVEYDFPFPPTPSIINSRTFWQAPRSSGVCSPLQASGNFLVSAKALSKRDWPLFDSDFGLSGGEDSEWFVRLSSLGFGFAWAGDALIREAVEPARITPQWARRRAYRSGNADTRASLKHRNWAKTGSGLARATIVLTLAPLMAPALALPDWRLWLQVKWWRAAGRYAALFGRHYQEYAKRHIGHAETH